MLVYLPQNYEPWMRPWRHFWKMPKSFNTLLLPYHQLMLKQLYVSVSADRQISTSIHPHPRQGGCDDWCHCCVTTVASYHSASRHRTDSSFPAKGRTNFFHTSHWGLQQSSSLSWEESVNQQHSAIQSCLVPSLLFQTAFTVRGKNHTDF